MHYAWNGTLTHLLSTVLTPIQFGQYWIYLGLKWIPPGRGKFHQNILQLGRKVKIWRGGPGSAVSSLV